MGKAKSFWVSLLSKEWLVYLIIFLAALIPRIVELGINKTTDYNSSVNDITNFMRHILNGELKESFSNYPAVPWYFLSGLCMLMLGVLGPMQPAGQTQFDVNLANNYLTWQYDRILNIAIVLPLVIIGVATIVAAYPLLKKLFNKEIAFISCMLLAFSPMNIAYARVAFVDMMHADFIFLAILLMLVYFQNFNRKYFYAASVMTGLAFLTKVGSSVAFPIFMVTVFCIMFFSQTYGATKFKKPIQMFLIWAVIAFGVFWALFPAMWVAPGYAIKEITGVIFKFGTAFRTEGNLFFWGKSVPNSSVGLSFYLTFLLLNLTPIVLIFSLFAFYYILRRFKSGTERNALFLALYCIMLVLFMSMGSAKSPRYIMSVYALLPVLAAYGVYNVSKDLFGTKKKFIALSLGILILFQFLSAISFHPYYTLYTSPMIGSHRRAMELFGPSLTSTEGYDQLAAYLHDKPNPENITVGIMQPQVFRTMFKGVSANKGNFMSVDYFIIHRQEINRPELWGQLNQIYMDYNKPEKIIKIHNVPYIWIYKNEPEFLNRLKPSS
jgi:hypothetical protein